MKQLGNQLWAMEKQLQEEGDGMSGMCTQCAFKAKIIVLKIASQLVRLIISYNQKGEANILSMHSEQKIMQEAFISCCFKVHKL